MTFYSPEPGVGCFVLAVFGPVVRCWTGTISYSPIRGKQKLQEKSKRIMKRSPQGKTYHEKISRTGAVENGRQAGDGRQGEERHAGATQAGSQTRQARKAAWSGC